MLSIAEAWRCIEREVERAAAVRCRLSAAHGLVLAESIAADADSPPFDKSLMDGYAVRMSDLQAGVGRFQVTGVITAGMFSDRAVGTGEAIQIMTGAPLPPGADCVIPVERTRAEGEWVEISGQPLRAGWNIARRGEAVRAGAMVLPEGTVLGPAQLGALAEMGRAEVSVIPRASLAILATGDELVPFGQDPGPAQIRNSNELMLSVQAAQAGAQLAPLGIAPDQREPLEEAIRKGLQEDILCLSGGVSAGTRDLVPSVLAAVGVEEVFHGCDVKPGRPVYFGRLAAERAPDGRPHWIFGLPGNPVSSMVCFELFARTALNRRCGIDPAIPVLSTAVLGAAHDSKDARPTFFPAVATRTEEGWTAHPLDWKGSFDLQSTARANALILFEERREYFSGERIRMLPLNVPGSVNRLADSGSA